MGGRLEEGGRGAQFGGKWEVTKRFWEDTDDHSLRRTDWRETGKKEINGRGSKGARLRAVRMP